MIILDEGLNNPHLCHGPLVVAFKEETTLIPKYARFENAYFGQRSRDFLECFHRRTNCLNRILQNTFSRKSCSR